jgi:prepilin-type N-terminal cleavage/methylation domain-containing protein
MKLRQKGFTLIELLIVIALIGVLAVALLSTINPIEQTRKAKDSSRKAAAAELLNSIERFQSTFFCYPWEMTGGECVDTSDAQEVNATTITGTETWFTELQDKNEIKPEFAKRKDITEGKLIITEDTEGLAHVCFDPKSKTFDAQACKTNVGADTTCGVDGNYICVPE